MTLRLQQAIDIAELLSMAEKLELLKKLSVLIQEAHALENQTEGERSDPMKKPLQKPTEAQPLEH